MPVDDGPNGPDRARLDALDARIRAAQDARRPQRSRAAGDMSSAALAWRMVTELVIGVLLGAGIGWGIDGAAGTMPLFLLIFGMLGFAAGVRTMMRSAAEVTRRGAAADAKTGGDAERKTRGGAAAKKNGADGAQERS
jgi:ATP synthase protein I